MLIIFRFNAPREAKFVNDMIPSHAPAARFKSIAEIRRDTLLWGKRLCYTFAAVAAIGSAGHAYHGRYDHALGGAAASLFIMQAGRARRDGIPFHDGLIAAADQGVIPARTYLREAMNMGQPRQA